MAKFSILFILTYLAGLSATILIDVSWGIYLYQLVYFLNPAVRWWSADIPNFRYSMIIAGFILFSYFIRPGRYSNSRLFDVPQTKWLTIFLIMMAITSFWAVWPEKHNGFLISHIKLMVFIAIAYKVIDTPAKFERMIWAFLIGNFYIGWLSHNLGRTGFGRLEGTGPADTGGDGNAAAAILLTAVPFLLFYLIKGKLWQRFISIIMLAYIMDAIILINSRGAFLGLSVSISYLFLSYFFTKDSDKNKRIPMVLIFLFALGLFVYLADIAFWERMLTIKTEIEKEGGPGRIFFWLKTFDIVKEYPFGVGGWGYQYLSPQFLPNEMLVNDGRYFPRRAVHSIYFQCFAEYGYMGILVFGSMISSNIILIIKSKRYLIEKGNFFPLYMGTAILSGFIGFLTASIFLSLLYAEILYWFILFSACYFRIFIFNTKSDP